MLLILSNLILSAPVTFAEGIDATSYQLEKDSNVYHSTSEEPVGTLLSQSSIQPLYENENAYYFQWGDTIAFIKKHEDKSHEEYSDGLLEQTPIEVAGVVHSDDRIPIYNHEGQLMAYAEHQYSYLKENDETYEVTIGGVEGYISKKDIVTTESDLEDIPEEPKVESTLEEEEEVVVVETLLQPEKQLSFTNNMKFFKVVVDELPIYKNEKGVLVPIGKLYKNQSYERLSDSGNWHRIRYGNEIAYVLKQSTIPSSKADIPLYNASKDSNRTFTTVTNTDVFENSTGALIKFASIQQGVTYPIIGNMGNWYKVNIAGRMGFIHSGNVTTNFQDSDQYFQVTKDKLGVFSNEGGKLVQRGELSKGAVYKRVRNYGNWHEINIGGKLLYVLKASTVPANSSSIKNMNSQKTGSDAITTTNTTPVFDNSSGALVQFGVLYPQERFNLIGKMGNWFKIELGGRLGYVHDSNVELAFKSSDRYFEVTENDVYIFDNSLGYLQKVAMLHKGQTYERIQEYGNWHKIKYGRGYGFVHQSSTKPSNKGKAKNWGSPSNSNVDFIARGSVEVFDNTSGALVPFMMILDKERYPIIGEYGSWWKISIANRIGYIHKSKVTVGPIYQYSNYNLTLDKMIDIQAGLRPQTDLYRNNPAYVHKDYITLDQPASMPANGTVTADNLNVREAANNNAWIYGSLKFGQKVKVLKAVGDWYQIEYGSWRNAKRNDVARYITPANIKQNSPDFFQFLVLSQPAGISPSDVDSRILYNKGILKNKGQSFVQASNTHRINEIYLISHALLETGNGTSALANGVLVDTVDGKAVEPKVVYNMFGIGAVDRCPITCGAETAYKNGWFTPEAAIMGGAKFISTMYIHHPTYQQDTIYKMRWNPNRPGTHQYATDIAWAFKQVTRIKQLYDLLDHYTLYYDIPVYK